MICINKLSLSEPVDFAASELKKYLQMMMPECGMIEIRYDPKATKGFRLGLMEDFGLICEAEDVELDDVVHVETTAEGGILAGSNPRSVLYAVYRLLKENGCRWLFPGKDGEFIPRKQLEGVSYHKMADHRIRAHTTEGDPTLEMALDFIDFQTKHEMNHYGLYEIWDYHERYYRHRYNESRREPEPLPYALAQQWEGLCQAELTKRGLRISAGGHGWVEQVVGFDLATCDEYALGAKPLPEEICQNLAMLDGERKLNRYARYTNFCMSRADLRKKFAKIVADYCEKRPQLQELSVSLADNSHNHCECEECQKKRPSDFFVMVLNEIDEELTARNLPTKIMFSSYVDWQFAPLVERIKNPKRFILKYCAISRDYSSSLNENSVIPEPNPYIRNKWEPPKTNEEGIALFKKWQEVFPGDCMVYEYHFWLHQYRDLGGYQFARRIYEDVRAWKPYGMNGGIQDGSNRSFFPNGLCQYIYFATLWDRDLDFDEAVNDYYMHCYGEEWRFVKQYFKRISAAFDHAYMCGNKSSDPEKSDYYNPGHVADLEQVREYTAQVRDKITRNKLALPTRPQNVCWRLLRRHTELCERMVDVMIEKCYGRTTYPLEMLHKTLDDFCQYDYEMERYFDFALARVSLNNVVRIKPKIEL